MSAAPPLRLAPDWVMDCNIGTRRRHELDALVVSIPRKYRSEYALPNISACIAEIRNARGKFWDDRAESKPLVEPKGASAHSVVPKKRLNPPGTVDAVFDSFPPLEV